ncbi:unnamed protein product [marine sediment metagenome]|uniref:Uncharacterized protein n=1 Tax=marine sediment metagenome TaxID=412755 RepID=X0ZAF1_9ZZZZ
MKYINESNILRLVDNMLYNMDYMSRFKDFFKRMKKKANIENLHNHWKDDMKSGNIDCIKEARQATLFIKNDSDVMLKLLDMIEEGLPTELTREEHYIKFQCEKDLEDLRQN